jgi:hypothetical protein
VVDKTFQDLQIFRRRREIRAPHGSAWASMARYFVCPESRAARRFFPIPGIRLLETGDTANRPRSIGDSQLTGSPQPVREANRWPNGPA